MIAAMSSVVATGRRMKIRDGLMEEEAGAERLNARD
jgi:hypothetical protein